MKKLTTILFILSLLLIGCKESFSPVVTENKPTLNDKPENSDSPAPSNIPDTTKVLFIGNSLTYFNNMPDMVKQLAEMTDKKVFINKATIGGVPLRNMVNNSFIINKINSDDWDYVVLQSDDITAFPDMYNSEINTLTTFKTRILNNNSSTKIIYLMVWGLRNGRTLTELNGEIVTYSYTEYMQKIYDGTLYVANETDLIISPAGWTWKEVRDNHPEIELFSSDNAHPSYKGSYLCAAVHYSVIFKESCANIQYNGNLSSEEASILRSTASSMVLENLDLWNLSGPNGIY